MNKILSFIFIFFSAVIIHAQVNDTYTPRQESSLLGVYFETTIPPFIKQINNDASEFFSGSFTYMDFGLGASFGKDILRAQINYGFMTEGIYKSLGKEVKNDYYGGNVFSMKFSICPEYNLGHISNMYLVSASFGFGVNFSLFQYTPFDDYQWLYSCNIQLEFPKITLQDRKYFRAFSLFMEHQLWYSPNDDSIGNNAASNKSIYHLVVGVRAYIL